MARREVPEEELFGPGMDLAISIVACLLIAIAIGYEMIEKATAATDKVLVACDEALRAREPDVASPPAVEAEPKEAPAEPAAAPPPGSEVIVIKGTKKGPLFSGGAQALSCEFKAELCEAFDDIVMHLRQPRALILIEGRASPEHQPGSRLANLSLSMSRAMNVARFMEDSRDFVDNLPEYNADDGCNIIGCIYDGIIQIPFDCMLVVAAGRTYSPSLNRYLDGQGKRASARLKAFDSWSKEDQIQSLGGVGGDEERTFYIKKIVSPEPTLCPLNTRE